MSLFCFWALSLQCSWFTFFSPLALTPLFTSKPSVVRTCTKPPHRNTAWSTPPCSRLTDLSATHCSALQVQRLGKLLCPTSFHWKLKLVENKQTYLNLKVQKQRAESQAGRPETGGSKTIRRRNRRPVRPVLWFAAWAPLSGSGFHSKQKAATASDLILGESQTSSHDKTQQNHKQTIIEQKHVLIDLSAQSNFAVLVLVLW